MATPALLLLLMGAFLSMTDFFIVNVALADIQSSLRASASTLELVIAGYGITYALLLVAGGRLGDAIGRRRVFLIGMAAFGIASLLCGLAPTAGLLVAARVVQGAAAAMVTPQVLATIQATLTGAPRLRAISWFGATAGLGAIVGQVGGGWLVSANIAGSEWRSIFLVNIPVVVVGLILGRRLIPETRSPNPARHDVAGTVLLGLGLLALLIPLTEGAGSWWAWLILATAPIWLLACVLHERRVEAAGRVPLVPPTLIAVRSMSQGLLLSLLFFAGFGGFMFTFAVMTQRGLGLSAMRAGLLLAPMMVAFLTASLLTPRLVARFERRPLIALGSGAMAITLAASAFEVFHGWPEPSLVTLGVLLTLAGFAQGLVAPTLFSLTLSEVPPSQAGFGSGVMSTTQQVALALGVAVLGYVFTTVTAHSGSMGTGFGVVVGAQALLCLTIAGIAGLGR